MSSLSVSIIEYTVLSILCTITCTDVFPPAVDVQDADSVREDTCDNENADFFIGGGEMLVVLGRFLG